MSWSIIIYMDSEPELNSFEVCRRPMLNTRQKHITESSTPHRRQTVIMVLSDPSINDRGDSQLCTFSVF